MPFLHRHEKSRCRRRCKTVQDRICCRNKSGQRAIRPIGRWRPALQTTRLPGCFRARRFNATRSSLIFSPSTTFPSTSNTHATPDRSERSIPTVFVLLVVFITQSVYSISRALWLPSHLLLLAHFVCLRACRTNLGMVVSAERIHWSGYNHSLIPSRFRMALCSLRYS